MAESFPARYLLVNVPFFLSGQLKNSLLGRLLAYGYCTIIACGYAFKDKFDIVLPTSDFFFDIIPAVFFKLRGLTPRLVFIVHHAILRPFKRRGEILKNLILFLMQRFGFLLMAVFSDRVFVYATKEGDKIKAGLQKLGVPAENIASVWCGIDLKKMERVMPAEKEFTACFIGGLRPAKGLEDIVPIWRKVCLAAPQSRLLIVGSGLNAYVEKLRKEIRDSGMGKNIFLFSGHIEEDQLYKKISASRMLILPSYEEGWSIVICEALSLGVPAVVYSLDVFDIFSDAVLRVKIGDTRDFARAILEASGNDGLYERLKNNAIIISRKFDWEKAAELEEGFLSDAIS